MGLGSCVVVELQPQDDFASIQYRLKWVERGRVALILPWDMRFLTRPLDFDLLRREAERNRLEIAVISTDPERVALAERCGFPAFYTVSRAQETAVWRVRPPDRADPPPRHWWDAEVVLRPRASRPRPRWLAWIGLVGRLLIFLLVLAILATSAYAVVPSAAVTLTPAGRKFTTIVPVGADPGVEAVVHATAGTGIGVIPARWVGDYFEGYTEVETTGVMSIVGGRATGTVLFTNLLAQDYTVPAGTVVRTSSTSYPIRFRTTAPVAVPAGGQATVPVEGITEGTGNVGAFQINRVEGVAASAVRVTNPNATSGAEARDVRVVTQADYDRARVQLMRQIFDQAAADLSNLYLEPTEMLLRQSLRIEAVPKESYTRFVTEPADKVGLSMQLLVRGLAVDTDDAEGVAYVVLSRRLPAGYSLVNASFDVGEVAEEDVSPYMFTLFVTASGYAAVGLDAGAAVEAIRGRPLADARRELLARFPLAEDPHIVLWPEWPEKLRRLERVPYLPLRIHLEISPSEDLAGGIER